MGCIPGQAIGLAMITVVGRCVGAEDYAQAKKYTGKLMLTTYICMGAICSVMFFLTPTVVGFFHLSEPTMKLAVEVAQSYALWAMAIWPCSFTMPNALRAANDVKFTMIVSIISMWVSRIGLSYVFGKWMNMGLMGVWLAMYCDSRNKENSVSCSQLTLISSDFLKKTLTNARFCLIMKELIRE